MYPSLQHQIVMQKQSPKIIENKWVKLHSYIPQEKEIEGNFLTRQGKTRLRKNYPSNQVAYDTILTVLPGG